jgi:hypothetical protein
VVDEVELLLDPVCALNADLSALEDGMGLCVRVWEQDGERGIATRGDAGGSERESSEEQGWRG